MRILFFHQGRINDWAGAVLNGLKGQFPEAEVLVFDLHKLIKEHPAILAANAAVACAQYGMDLARGKRDLDDAFFTTGYIFHKVREISAEIHQKFPSDFSFQMHSMHDHSSLDRPHFVYTDFTYADCRKYSVYGKYRWVPKRSDRLLVLERGIYERASCTFSQTQAVASTIVHDYKIPGDRILNVRYGPNLDASILRRIERGAEERQTKKILFIGGDWHRKGGPELIKAFERIKQSHNDASLVVVGSKPSVDTSMVTVVGKVQLSDLPDHFSNATVFCMPSRLEPSAGVYVEAMHAGLPVVALDTPATREVVRDGETGFLVREDDINGLASAISELLASPALCVAMGARGRDIAQEEYVWDHTFSRVGERIRDCLGNW